MTAALLVLDLLFTAMTARALLAPLAAFRRADESAVELEPNAHRRDGALIH